METREKPQEGQESVWDYPRPPRLELSSRVIRVTMAGTTIAETTAAYRLLETSHPPSWYIPRSDINMELLIATGKGSFCEWKGAASYWSAQIPGTGLIENAAWSYESPNAKFTAIRGYLAFYPKLLECFVDGELVEAQPGGFYGGWITREVVGPFKGAPGSWGW